MATPTLGGIDLDKLQTISNEKSGNILPLPLPTGDSDDTEVFDLLGVTRIITLSGTFVGTTAQVKSKIEAIEALIDGDQSATISLITDEIGTKLVKVNTISSNWDLASTGNRASYTIQCIEGV